MSAYSEKLRDPRWQKRRLEIMERDGFKCVECRSEHKTLHVHHSRYLTGLDPWQYPDSLLLTLCESCHDRIHEGMPVGSEVLLSSILRHGGTSELLWLMAEAINDTAAPDEQISTMDWVKAVGAFCRELSNRGAEDAESDCS